MKFPACRVVIFLVFVGLLFTQPGQVSGLRSADLALRFLRNSRTLKGADVQELHENLNMAPTPSMMFDPNQSNKRRVRRGSDPIHNRCWYVRISSLFLLSNLPLRIQNGRGLWEKVTTDKRRNCEGVLNLCFLPSPFSTELVLYFYLFIMKLFLQIELNVFLRNSAVCCIGYLIGSDNRISVFLWQLSLSLPTNKHTRSA